MTLPNANLDPLLAIAPREGVFRRVVHNPLGLASMIILAVVVVVGALAPWIEPHAPNSGALQLINASPAGEYLLGGDGSGRDIFSRLVAATRLSLLSALTGTVVAIVVGVSSGLVAGYYGKGIDAVGSWTSNVLRSVPAIIALIALYAAIGPSTQAAMVLFGVLISPGLFRLVRNLVIGVKGELYVDAARVAGLSDARIITRHIFYAIRGPVIVQAAFIAGVTIAIQAGLDFLGLGDPNQASWGSMLQDAFTNLYIAPVQLVWPGLTLALTISALVLLGNAVRDALEGATLAGKGQRQGTVRVRSTARSRTGDLRRSIANPQISTAEAYPDATNHLLTVEGLTIAYPRPGSQELHEVVHGVSFTIAAGEVVGLVGESGSGKTQTAFSILGLLPKEASILAGRVSLEGQDLRALSMQSLSHIRGRAIGYVPQEPLSNLDPSFKVGRQLVYGVRASTAMSAKEAKREVLALFSRVGLRDPRRVFASYPHELSGGMAQRVLIAGAVAARPQLLIADEPTTALDVTVQAEILELLRDLQQERHMGVLLVTHNFGVVADLCDRVIVMNRGSIVEQGTTADIFARPKNPYTRQLLDAVISNDLLRDEPDLERRNTA